MKKNLCVLLMLAVFNSSFSQNFEWETSLGSSVNETGNSIATDRLGNVITLGSFNDTVDFDPTTGVLNLISTDGNSKFIYKQDASGSLIWVKQLDGILNGISIKTDSIGNIYIAGRFSDTVDFNPGILAFNMISNGGEDIFLIKLNSAGNFIWARQIGAAANDNVYSMDVDNVGNVFSTGSFSGTLDFDPGSGTYNLTSTGNDVYISKLDSAGNFSWTKQMGNYYMNEGRAISLDESGNVYTIGTFQSWVDFNPGIGDYSIYANYINGAKDVFVCKLDASGNFIWAKQITTGIWSGGLSVDVDANENTYLTGYFYGTHDFNPGSSTFNLTADDIEPFIVKLNSSGSFAWAKRLGGTFWIKDNTLACDATGNIFMTGKLEGYSDFDPGFASYVLSSSGGGGDIYVTKLNASGNFQYTKLFRGYGDDNVGAIALDLNSNVFVTGAFADSVDFDSGTPTYLQVSKGGLDAFVCKLGACQISFALTSASSCDPMISPSGNFIWYNNGTYVDVIPNYAGCDSVLNVNFTLNATFSTVSMEDCDSVLSPSGLHYYIYTGNYLDTLVNSIGCDSIITVEVNIPWLDTTIAQTGFSLSANDFGYTYQWLDCNNNFAPIIGANTQSFTASTNGDYAVAITLASIGCSDTSSCYSVNTVGVNESVLAYDLIIKPNPSSGIFSIEMPDNAKQFLEIYNLLGEKIYSSSINRNKVEIDLSRQAKGAYLVKIISEKTTFNQKIIID